MFAALHEPFRIFAFTGVIFSEGGGVTPTLISAKLIACLLFEGVPLAADARHRLLLHTRYARHTCPLRITARKAHHVSKT